MKRRTLPLALLLTFGITVNCFGQISGPTSVTLNNTYNYSYYSPTILAGASWFPSGGTVMSQWQGGSEYSGFYYYADIKWTATGERNVMFANFSEPLSTLYVDVCSSGQAAGVSLPSTVSICAGYSYQFTATPTNGGATPNYVWKVNGVTKQSGSNNKYTASQLALNDVISVTMTSSIDCLSPRSATASCTVTNVTQGPPVTATVSDPGPICPPTDVNFTVSVANGGSEPTYVWYRNGSEVIDNQISGNTDTYDPYYTLQDGDKIYCFVTSNTSSCISGPASVWSDTVTIDIQDQVIPSVDIGVQNQTMCEGDPVTFVASSPQSITSYSWSIGESVELGSSSTFSPSGEFALRSPGEMIHLTVGVSGACLQQYVATDSLYQTVYAPSSIGSLSVNSTEFCSSGTVNFTVSSNVGTLSWKMQYRDGNGNWTGWTPFSPTSNSYGVVSGSGVKRTYQFQAFATNGTCTPAESDSVTVYVYPPSALGAFDVSQAEVCISGQVGLTLASFAGDLTWRYRYKDGPSGAFGSWSVFSTDETNSLSSPILTTGGSVDRIYEIEVQASSGVCTPTPWKTRTITVYPPPSVQGFSVSPGTEFYGNATPALTLSHTSAVGSVAYEASVDGTNWSPFTNGTTVGESTKFWAKATIGGCPATYTDPPISVFLYPTPTITSLEGTSYLSYGNVMHLTTGTYYSYQWARDGQDIAGADQQTFMVSQPGAYTVRVKGSSTAPSSTSSGFEIYDAAPSQDENYISTITFQRKGVNADALYSLRPQDYSQSTVYFDGLGRPMQTVNRGGSPAGKDVIQPVVYDAFGREARKYLPFASQNSRGLYEPNNLIIDLAPEGGDYIGIAAAFYDSPGTNVADDDGDKPFAQTVFEDSPLNRVMEQGAPGATWHPDGNNTIKFSYETNVAQEVLLWRYSRPSDGYPLGLVYPGTEVTPNTPVYYAANQLFKNVTKDEHDHEVIEYKDKEGRVVLKRVQAVDPPLTVGSDTHYASTYYIYDDFGQLVCVIPPEAVSLLPSQYYQSGSEDPAKEEFLRRWAFRYRYDGRKRMIMKQVPGADSVRMVYDKRDRLVLTQDGNQKTANQWLFTKYDELNRPVMTGIYTHGAAVNQKEMSGLLSTTTISETFDGSSANHGYTNNVFPTQNGQVLTVTYYDDYDFKPLINDPNVANGEFEYKNDELQAGGGLKAQETEAFLRVKNQITGSKTAVLGSSDLLWTVNYYDDRYRLIQTTSSNAKGGVTRLTNVYDFVGKVLRTKTRYILPGHPTQPDTKISQRFSYDHAGRLLKTWHQIEGGPEVVISSNEYNELGQLVAKKLHQTSIDGTPVTADPVADAQGTTYDANITSSSYSSSSSVYVASNSIRLLPGFTVPANSTFTAKIGYSAEDALAYNNSLGGEYLQVVDYRYNIRGWLKTINDPSDPLSDDLFNMELNYNTPTAKGGDAQYNGNISEAVWKSAGLDKQSYGYDYDPMNRILTGKYYNPAKPIENGNYDESIGDPSNPGQYPAYDLNGNIQNLLRKGKTDVGTHGLMDRLHYDYGGSNQTTGNRLSFVSDAQATGPQEEGFKEIAEGTTDYDYDDNGNLVKDENKGITGDAGSGLAGLEYNHLNLPSRVSKNLTDYMVYTYDATGTKLSQQVFGAEAKTTEYVGELVFEDNVLQFILQPEGRVVADTESGAPDPWEYQYFLKDHLGNTRVVFSEKKTSQEYKVTLEDDRQNIEMADFPTSYPGSGSRSAVDEFDHTDAGTVYNRSLLLHGGETNQVGLAKSFAVNPGDVFDLEVYAKYLAPGGIPNNLNALFSGIVSAFQLGTATSPLDGAAAYSAMENVFQGGGPWINSSMWDPAAPKAYLNYLLFDENFVLVDFGFDQISTDGEQNAMLDPVVPHDYLSLHVKVEQKGYLYVYLSNEQATLTNVHFDDFKIVHYSAVEQVSDYYPFGLTFNSYQRENSVGQQWKFQGQEHVDDLGVNWDSFKWRNHQPDIGRFFNIDPLADKYVYNSPYAFSENQVTTHVELEGLEKAEYMVKQEFENKLGFLVDKVNDAMDAVASGANSFVSAMLFSDKLPRDYTQRKQFGNNLIIHSESTGGPDAKYAPSPDPEGETYDADKSVVDALTQTTKATSVPSPSDIGEAVKNVATSIDKGAKAGKILIEDVMTDNGQTTKIEVDTIKYAGDSKYFSWPTVLINGKDTTLQVSKP